MVTLHRNWLIWAVELLMMPDEAHHAPDELLRATRSLLHIMWHQHCLLFVLRLFMFHNFSFIEEKFLCGLLPCASLSIVSLCFIFYFFSITISHLDSKTMNCDF